MNVTDLFCGIGGFSLGFTRAGHTVTHYSETNPFCCQIMHKHWPTAINLGDIANVQYTTTEIVTAGPPCQPISRNGKRKAEDDPRWPWDHLIRIAQNSRPRWLVIEQPLGILDIPNRGIDWILYNLEAIHYTTWTYHLSAPNIGSPTFRKRIFILAHTPGNRRQGRMQAPRQRPKTTTKTRQLPAPQMLHPWPPRPRQVSQIPTETDGIPNRLPGRTDRLTAIGNAVIPQLAELIARTINHYEESQ